MTGRIWFETLGCKANQYDSERLRTALLAAGWTPAARREEADLVVVNTCAVTGEAERKSRQALRRAGRVAPGARVVAVGCLVKALELQDRALPPVALARDDGAREEGMADLLAALGAPGALPPPGIDGFGDRTRAFLKIQDGCDNRCTYCIIPSLRGPSRSRPRTAILEEARTLVAAGVPELVLTGVCLGAWQEGGSSLADLVAELAALPGTWRLRLSSIEPEHTDGALLAAMAAPRVCPHLHLPLQAGSDRVLRRMGRRYRAADYLALVARAREALAAPALTTDVIVGFPGESPADFERTCQRVREAAPLRLHVFPYSPRATTPATRLPDPVPGPEARARAARLRELGDALALQAARDRLGAEEEVALEETHEGWSGRYQRIRLTGAGGRPGTLARVRIVDHRGPDLVGTVVSAP